MDHPEVQDPAAPSAPAPPGTAPSPAPRLALEEPADGVEVLEPDGNDTGKDLAPYADTWREATGSRSGPDRSAKIRALFRLGRTQDRVRQEIPHMADRKPIESWLTDMDGVLIHEGVPIPGADAFIKRLRESGKPFLVLTNNSIYTPRDLHARLRRMGLEVPIESIWTSALATAKFLDDQRPNGSAYVIGEAGLTTALHDIGYVLTDHEPDYVVLGETRTYSFEAMTKAVRLINGGARFICTNPDETGPSTEGPLPATGAVAALITKATGKQPYFAGKPNPLMMRTGLNAIGAHSESSAMIGDRMDTDVLAGIEAGMQTFLVLTGLTLPEQVENFPYRPSKVVDSIADIVDLV
ncbi:hypothetical protein GCM10010266_09080 [Streptomyces griseomycini]|uniref:NagD protein n=2 Tax=Streptomyces griseomycini TaxID=66895 RepID=A0A7W7V8D8_9ACTN|nr:NagD protein [Streptomyces griseomycini]GGP88158.1 hypothetical protein GCM10010266_09080 [Streptomyces griseomycini]